MEWEGEDDGGGKVSWHRLGVSPLLLVHSSDD